MTGLSGGGLRVNQEKRQWPGCLPGHVQYLSFGLCLPRELRFYFIDGW